ncbi:MAG: hypothetical protein JST81_10205 [Bacteroidetes bacterium]|nr:hypothetical protein [Bacteroidota bacterium]
MKSIKSILTLAIASMFVLSSCDKTKPYDIAVSAPRAHFVGKETQTYNVIDNPAPSFTLQVGTTDVSNADRLVTYNISSTSGAAAGTQYTIPGFSGNTGSVTVKGGEALADIVIQADYNEYSSGRRDTLLFTISTPSLEPAAFLDTVKVILAGPSGCSEGNPDFAATLGNYANTNETLAGNPYGPYTTAISSVTPTGPTSATMVVENIWDNGWGPIEFTLDWSDPSNPTTTCVQQNNIPGSDAGDLNSTYAGMPVAVRANATSGPGTYSACDQRFVLNMQLGVGNGAGGVLGYFNALYQVILER